MILSGGEGTLVAAATGTEVVVYTVVAPGDYVFIVKRAAQQAGDTVQLRVREQFLSTDASSPFTSLTVVRYKEYTTPPVSADDYLAEGIPVRIERAGAVFTIKPVVGVRSWPWRVSNLNAG